MGLILGTGVVDDDPVGVPLIGYENIVTASGVASTTAATGFPIDNVANPATHLKWVGGVNTGLEIIAIDVNREIDYVGVVGHNWGTLGLTLQVNVGAVEATSLLHFETGDSPAAFVDSAPTPHVWLPVGNATISSADFKFGSASGLFDGTGDYLTGDGSSSFAFGTGDFTIDFWVKFNSLGTDQAMYDSRPVGINTFYPTIYKSAANVLKYFTNNADQITGTTSLTSGVWYHVAVTRASSVTRLFLNGVQEGSNYADSNTYLNGTSRPAIGASGAVVANLNFNGRLDELRVIKGTAAWTSAFTVPTTAYSNSVTQINTSSVTDDSPIIFRIAPQFVSTLYIVLSSFTDAPEAAVIYVGDLLVLERSITIGRGHVPITYGRRTNVINGMSESGNFLGRIVLGSYLESKAEFEWFTPDFYRSDIDDFLDAAREIPFFWAWSPDEYPAEVGYVWLTNNAEPEVDPVTRRIALELQMRGIA